MKPAPQVSTINSPWCSGETCTKSEYQFIGTSNMVKPAPEEVPLSVQGILVEPAPEVSIYHW